jgi:predicted DsbA family dithiol-disulfide isomerase
MTKPTIKVDVISDVVCPWCYIGKRRLEKALNKLDSEYTFEVTYHPFELNPSIPESGINQKQYLSQKFGGEERYEKITAHVTQVAAEEGITFNFHKQAVSPNTRSAHRIIQLAKHVNLQTEVKEAFMKAYFTDGVDLSKNENLITCATQAGMESNIVEQLLASDMGVAEVIQAEKEIQQLGITGVPFYIINNKYGLSGAQPPDAFIEVIQKAALENASV